MPPLSRFELAKPYPVGDADQLRAEAAAIGRFILKRPIEAEFIDRYVAAHEHLALRPSYRADATVLAFAMTHVATLPSLDAAAALVRPQALLHRKALLLTAILEASPRYADQFLPRTRSWLGLAALVARVGLATMFQIAVGVLILAMVERRA